MTKKNKKYARKTKKQRKIKNSRKYKGGAQYYAEEGDPDRDSLDVKMQEVLGRIGISNAPDDKQYSWLSIGIAGIIGVVGLGYLVIKKR